MIDHAIRALTLLVVAGLLLLLFGVFDRNDPIMDAWVSPQASTLVVRTATGQMLVYELPLLESPASRAAVDARWIPLAWGDERSLIVRAGEEIAVLVLEDLSLRPFFMSKSETVLLGQSGRMLVGIDPALPEQPMATFSLANFARGTIPAPSADSSGLPFDTLLAPAAVRPFGVKLELRQGGLIIEHPALDGARQLELPRPRLMAAAAVIFMAAALVILRQLRVMRERRQRQLTAR